MAKARSRTLRLTRQQYRSFAKQTKAVGLGLNLSTFERMGCWGTYSPWGLLVCKDASSEEPQWDERALITLASSINPDAFRAAGKTRPEIDWSALRDDEIYPFIINHEIGHRIDNFDVIRVHFGIKDSGTHKECSGRLGFVNEILADRYAWNAIRPGEAAPLSTSGLAFQERAAASLVYLEKHAPKMSAHVRPLSPHPYQDVPDYMLASHERAAFIGPNVSVGLVASRAAYHRNRLINGGTPLY